MTWITAFLAVSVCAGFFLGCYLAGSLLQELLAAVVYRRMRKREHLEDR